MRIVLKIVLWLLAVPLGWFILAQTIGRLVRKLYPFPMSAFAARVLDLPVRWFVD